MDEKSFVKLLEMLVHEGSYNYVLLGEKSCTNEVLNS